VVQRRRASSSSNAARNNPGAPSVRTRWEAQPPTLLSPGSSPPAPASNEDDSLPPDANLALVAVEFPVDDARDVAPPVEELAAPVDDTCTAALDETFPTEDAEDAPPHTPVTNG